MPKEFSNLFDHFDHSFSKNPSKPALILDTGKEYNFTLLNHIFLVLLHISSVIPIASRLDLKKLALTPETAAV